MEVDRPIAIAFSLFLTLIIVIFFVAPRYNDFKDSQLRLGKIEAEYNSKNDYYTKVDKAFRDLQAKSDALTKVDNALPEKPSIADLIYFFQKKGEENGLVVKDLFLSKFSAQTQDSKIKEIVFSLDLLGSYASLKGFLSNLESSARIFEENSISLNLTLQGGAKAKSQPTPLEEQTYTFKLEVKTHSY